MWKSSENQQIHISETPLVFNMNNSLGQKMEAKEEPTVPPNWSEVPENTNPDDLDFSFPLATSLMDSLNCSPPAPFTLATLDELALWPSTTSSQLANNQSDKLKAATLPRRGPMTWPQVSSNIQIVQIFNWYMQLTLSRNYNITQLMQLAKFTKQLSYHGAYQRLRDVLVRIRKLLSSNALKDCISIFLVLLVAQHSTQGLVTHSVTGQHFETSVTLRLESLLYFKVIRYVL